MKLSDSYEPFPKIEIHENNRYVAVATTTMLISELAIKYKIKLPPALDLKCASCFHNNGILISESEEQTILVHCLSNYDY